MHRPAQAHFVPDGVAAISGPIPLVAILPKDPYKL
jgi:hypothetical protein